MTTLQSALQELERDWDRLAFEERKRRLGQLLLEVRFHPKSHTISITFRTTGIETLAASPSQPVL